MNDLNGVVHEERSLHTNPSSTSEPFDWTQEKLFVDRNGTDRTAEISPMFSSFLSIFPLKDKEGNMSRKSVEFANQLLDEVKRNPKFRSDMANCYLDNKDDLEKNPEVLDDLVAMLKTMS